MNDTSLPLLTRLWFAWVAWFRVLFDARFAARVFAVTRGQPPASQSISGPAPLAMEGALQLLGLLQREGRFVDFVQQEISAFPDADVGAAARVVHEGCRRALGSHARIVSVRAEAEGSPVTVDGSDADQIKLTGEVSGHAPYRGVLRHRGWRIESLQLPTRVGEQDLRVVAPAEVELR